MSTSAIPPIPQLASLAPQVEDFIRALEPYMIRSQGGVNYYILPPELNYLAQINEDPCVLPEQFTIFAAFDSKGLAARMPIVPIPHIEGTWVREDLRKTRTAYAIMSEVEKSIRAADRTHLFAFIKEGDTDNEKLMGKIGYKKQAVTVWVKDMTISPKLKELSKGA